MLLNCRNIFRRTFTQYFTHGNVNVFWPFFSLSLVFLSSISIGRVWTLGSMLFGGFARNSQLHAFLICFLSSTCVTNGIRCLTVAYSTQTMPCQSMRTIFPAVVCSFPCIKIHLFDFLAFHLFHRMQRNRIREKRNGQRNKFFRKEREKRSWIEKKCGLKTTFVWFHWFADHICIYKWRWTVCPVWEHISLIPRRMFAFTNYGEQSLLLFFALSCQVKVESQRNIAANIVSNMNDWLWIQNGPKNVGNSYLFYFFFRYSCHPLSFIHIKVVALVFSTSGQCSCIREWCYASIH